MFVILRTPAFGTVRHMINNGRDFQLEEARADASMLSSLLRVKLCLGTNGCLSHAITSCLLGLQGFQRTT